MKVYIHYDNNYYVNVYAFQNHRNKLIEVDVADDFKFNPKYTKYDIKNKTLINSSVINPSYVQENTYIDSLREQRLTLLSAYDRYKTSYLYGDIEATEQEKTTIKEWYKGILDLDENYFKNIPDKISYYIY